MITRIVKMTFQKEKINDFLDIFNSGKNTIRAFEGCLHLELLNDIQHPDIFFTYSKWKSDEYLGKYRDSEFFNITWNKTKKLFSAKPEAWTLKAKE